MARNVSVSNLTNSDAYLYIQFEIDQKTSVIKFAKILKIQKDDDSTFVPDSIHDVPILGRAEIRWQRRLYWAKVLDWGYYDDMIKFQNEDAGRSERLTQSNSVERGEAFEQADAVDCSPSSSVFRVGTAIAGNSTRATTTTGTPAVFRRGNAATADTHSPNDAQDLVYTPSTSARARRVLHMAAPNVSPNRGDDVMQELKKLQETVQRMEAAQMESNATIQRQQQTIIALLTGAGNASVGHSSTSNRGASASAGIEVDTGTPLPTVSPPPGLLDDRPAAPCPVFVPPSAEELQILQSTSSATHFASQLMLKVYPERDRANRNTRGVKGKEPLSPRRMAYIQQETVRRYYGNILDPKDAWNACRKAMDSKLRHLHG